MGAFEDECAFIFKDAIAAMAASVAVSPYKSKLPPFDPNEGWEKYRVLEDFTYNHSDQDPSHGIYHFKKDQEIKLRPIESRFLMDRSKLQKL